MRISRRRERRASRCAQAGAALCTLALLACARAAPGVEDPAAPAVPRTIAGDQVYTVEVWGAPASDTTVRFPAAAARTIVLRHGPPDNTVFAEVDVPAGALLPTAGGDSVTLDVQPVPGVYGVTLQSEDRLATPLRLTFKYPVHFAAPADSRTTYATDVLFERALVIALVTNDGAQYQTLRSTRPASDNLRATVATLGRYQVVAPR